MKKLFIFFVLALIIGYFHPSKAEAGQYIGPPDVTLVCDSAAKNIKLSILGSTFGYGSMYNIQMGFCTSKRDFIPLQSATQTGGNFSYSWWYYLPKHDGYPYSCASVTLNAPEFNPPDGSGFISCNWPPPPTPTSLPSTLSCSENTPSPGSITWSWTQVQGAKSYELWIAHQNSDGSSSTDYRDYVTGTSFTLPTTATNLTYQAAVYVPSIDNGTASNVVTCKSVAPPSQPPSSYTINGKVFIDANKDGAQNANEGPYYGASVNLSGDASGTKTTDSNGNYVFSGNGSGNFQVQLSVPAGYNVTTANNPATVSLPNGGTKQVNFGINQPPVCGAPCETDIQCPLSACNACINGFCKKKSATNSVSGIVFIDSNGDKKRDTDASGNLEQLSVGTPIALSGADTENATTDSQGQYSFSPSTSGGFTLTLTVPNGYTVTTPSSNPYDFTLGVGENKQVDFGIKPGVCPDSCTKDSDCQGATFKCGKCDLSTHVCKPVTLSAKPWFSGGKGDMRIDSGFVDKLPSVNVYGLYTLDYKPVFSVTTPLLGNGSKVTPQNVLITRSPFNPTGQTGGLATSYEAYQHALASEGIAPKPCPSNNISCVTPTGGGSQIQYYRIGSGGVTTINNSLTFSNGTYIILVDGSITISGAATKIKVSPGAAVIFAATGNITVDATVGEGSPLSQSNNSLCNPVAGDAGCDLEGIYVADKQFIVEGSKTANTCTGGGDPQLNIGGEVIANALLYPKSTYTNPYQSPFDFYKSVSSQRNLCDNNTDKPAVTITLRPDFLLNMPHEFFRKSLIWKEVIPDK